MATRDYLGQTWLHSGLKLRPSQIHGRGLVATRPLRKGETVLIFGGTLFSKTQVEAGKANNRTLMQIDDDSWLGNRAEEPPGEDYFINHSCDPNLWMSDEVTLTARRDIADGEEITMDYAMHFADPNWTMRTPCKCGSSQCRQIITGKDWTLARLQARYRDHFSPILNRRVATLVGTD
jgi:SET domain-containing protein